MATIFIYRGPVLLGSNLLWLRKQFTNPGIVKLLKRRIKFSPLLLGLKTGFNVRF